MTIECTEKAKIFNYALIGVNIFLIAFILGGWHRHHHHHGFMPGFGMMHHGFMHGQGEFRHHGFSGMMGQGMMENGGWQKHGQQFGMNGNHSVLASGYLFSQPEIAANHAFVKERMERIQALHREVTDSIVKGQATPDILKAKFAQIDSLRKEIRDHMEQKTIEKVASMTPEEKSQLSSVISRKTGESE